MALSASSQRGRNATASYNPDIGTCVDIWNVVCDHCDKDTLKTIRLLSSAHNRIGAPRVHKQHKVSLKSESVMALLKICNKEHRTLLLDCSWKKLLHYNSEAHKLKTQRFPQSMHLSALLKRLSIDMTSLCNVHYEFQPFPLRVPAPRKWGRDEDYMANAHEQKLVKSDDPAFADVFSQLQNLQALELYTLDVADGNHYIVLYREGATAVFFNLMKASQHLARPLKELSIRSGKYPRLDLGLFSRSWYASLALALRTKEHQSTLDKSICETVHALANLKSLHIQLYDSDVKTWAANSWLPELLSSPLLEHLKIDLTKLSGDVLHMTGSAKCLEWLAQQHLSKSL